MSEAHARAGGAALHEDELPRRELLRGEQPILEPRHARDIRKGSRAAEDRERRDQPLGLRRTGSELSEHERRVGAGRRKRMGTLERLDVQLR
jgi:hypothetical protein